MVKRFSFVREPCCQNAFIVKRAVVGKEEKEGSKEAPCCFQDNRFGAKKDMVRFTL